MKEKFNWGILGTGKIAKTFAEGLKFIPDANLIAVGSRSKDTAERFGQLFNIPRIHSSYKSLADDPDVDVIYVSTPHTFHAENSILCLNAGKAVLCEKAFTVNAREAREVVRVAREKKLFLMEAMWTRFLPSAVKVREWLKECIIGDVRIFSADFGIRADWDPEGRLLNPYLAGGALLDLGVYPIAYSSMIFNQVPNQIVSSAHIGVTNVDEQSAMIFKYDKGQLAVLYCAMRARSTNEAHIIGTNGSIKLDPFFFRSTKALVTVQNSQKIYDLPFEGNGYNYEALEVMNCMREGKLESGILPLDETISIMETMDIIRGQWGFKYPNE
jgi:dihydrodiol dehydrogenase / D-xylose 1-dehydrogenase (NADP)